MFGLGVPELLILLVLCLMVFGPGRLPQVGSSLGGAIRGFRRALDGPAPLDADGHGSGNGGCEEP